MITLKVEKRDLKLNLEALRKAGKIPAVYYGKKEQNTPISLSLVDFKKALKEAGESTIIHLDGPEVDVDVLIHDIAFDPVRDVPVHADFYAIDKNAVLEVDVPLEFIGTAPAVKDFGGILIKVMHEIKIEALPKDLPHNLTVDTSVLATLDSQVLAKDIVLPAGVTLKVKPEEVVASVYLPKDEPIEEKVLDVTAVEVEKKGKEAKEGEEGAEPAPAK